MITRVSLVSIKLNTSMILCVSNRKSAHFEAIVLFSQQIKSISSFSVRLFVCCIVHSFDDYANFVQPFSMSMSPHHCACFDVFDFKSNFFCSSFIVAVEFVLPKKMECFLLCVWNDFHKWMMYARRKSEFFYIGLSSDGSFFV